MLMNTSMAARALCAALSLAVFFSSSSRAFDSSLRSLENGLNDLIYEISRSVVTVEASHRFVTDGAGGTVEQAVESIVSSGIVCDSAGHVLVAARTVVGKDQIIVTSDNKAVPARLMAIDYQNGLALLNCPECSDQPVRFSERQSCAGQIVVGMGNAYGVHSAPSLGFCAGTRHDGTVLFSVLVASGAVGGGVFDLSGNLLGVITGGIGGESREAVALPAYMIPPIIDHLLRHGDRHSGFVGITTREIEITPPIRLSYSGSLVSAGGWHATSVERGVAVTSVLPGSPARRAGLAVGDLIYAVDGMPVNSASGLANLVRKSRPGTRMEIQLLRRSSCLSVPLEIGRKSLNTASASGSSHSPNDGIREIDSLKNILQLIKDEIYRLERRLNKLD